MSLTLSLLVALLWLLPGVAALVFWNQIGLRHGVRRPDQPLTALNGLALAVGVSLVAHLFGIGVTEVFAEVLRENGVTTASTAYRTMGWLMTRPVSGNQAVAIPTEGMKDLVVFALLLIALCYAVGAVMRSRGLVLAFDGVDSHAQGWAHQQIIQPGSHGFLPIAYVLTGLFEDGFGLGYAGVIAEVRLGEDGDVKAMALSEPDRFLYKLGAENASTRSTSSTFLERILHRGDSATVENNVGRFDVGDRRALGGAIVLPAAEIRNILVLHFRRSEIMELDPDAPTQLQDGVPHLGSTTTLGSSDIDDLPTGSGKRPWIRAAARWLLAPGVVEQR